MSVLESVGYMLHCDFPGCGFETRDISDEFSSWTDLDYAIEEWRDADGYHGSDGTYCRTHTIWVEDEDGDRDEIAPMPYTIASLFVLAERRLAERIENAARLARVRHDQRIRSWDLRDASIERMIGGRWRALPDAEVETLLQRSKHIVEISRLAFDARVPS